MKIIGEIMKALFWLTKSLINSCTLCDHREQVCYHECFHIFPFWLLSVSLDLLQWNNKLKGSKGISSKIMKEIL